MKRIPLDDLARRLDGARVSHAPRLVVEASRAWFTGCTHFGHAGVLRHAARPYDTVEAHDAALLEAMRARVGAEDALFVLGDASFRSDHDHDVAALPGRYRILVRGNHDHGRVLRSEHWDLVVDYLDLALTRPGSEVRAILCHYPMASWDGAKRTYHLHSHTHAKLAPLATEFGGRVDVGADAQGMAPVRIDTLIAQIDAHRAAHGFLVPGDY